LLGRPMTLYMTTHLAEYPPNEKFVKLNSLKGICHSFFGAKGANGGT
jgi:hypothetical protein